MDLYLIAEYTVPFDSLDVNVVLELHELADDRFLSLVSDHLFAQEFGDVLRLYFFVCDLN